MEHEKLAVLVEILGAYKISSGGEYLFYCPFCKHHKRKLSINIDKNNYHCWVCHKGGRSIASLVKAIGSTSQKSAWARFDSSTTLDFSDVSLEDKLRSLLKTNQEVKEEKDKQSTPERDAVLSLPKEFKTLATRKYSKIDKRALDYLMEERGYTKETIYRWKIGYASSGTYVDRVIIPSFSMDGYVNYFVGRTYSGGFPPYLTPANSKDDIIFNELMIDFSKSVILVEGVFDAMRFDGNAIPLLGSSLGSSRFKKKMPKLMNKLVEKQPPLVVLCLDPDAEDKQSSLARKLIKCGLTVATMDVRPYKDAGEIKDVKEVRERLKAAQLFTWTSSYQQSLKKI